MKRKGVIFTDMDTALEKHCDLLGADFMTKVVKANDGYFAALHGAFWQGGTFVYVPRGVEVPLPLRAAMWIEQRHAAFPHTLIVLEAGARAVFIDEYASAHRRSAGVSTTARSRSLSATARNSTTSTGRIWAATSTTLRTSAPRSCAMRRCTGFWPGLGTKLTKTFIDAVLAGRRLNGVDVGRVLRRWQSAPRLRHRAKSPRAAHQAATCCTRAR